MRGRFDTDQKCPGLRADGTPYTAFIRRGRCMDYGRVWIDKEYA